MIAVAIDGPAGAGKSTIARSVAKSLGFVYVDTGALYRAIGLYMINHRIDLTDTVKMAERLKNIQIALSFEKGEQKVALCGVDVTGNIRSAEVSDAASKVSAVPAVRDFLFSLQKDLAKKNNVIMDGRDIGTVVLPDAQVKIFLTASPETRAKRRYTEMIQKGMEANYEEVLSALEQRDYQDSHREIAPLMAAQDATLVDTTNNTLNESIAILANLIKERLNFL